MYEILATVYGVKPSKDQIGKIRDHYDDWPSHLGESPYSGMGTDGEDNCVSNTEFIGVELNSIPTFEFYGTKVEDLGKGLTDEIKEKAKSACKEIRLVVKGCEDFPEPYLFLNHYTS